MCVLISHNIYYNSSRCNRLICLSDITDWCFYPTAELRWCSLSIDTLRNYQCHKYNSRFHCMFNLYGQKTSGCWSFYCIPKTIFLINTPARKSGTIKNTLRQKPSSVCHARTVKPSSYLFLLCFLGFFLLLFCIFFYVMSHYDPRNPLGL